MMKRILHMSFCVIFLFWLGGCDLLSPPMDEPNENLTTQLTHIYNLAVEAEEFDGTYEEWLESVRGPEGPPGTDGREVTFQVSDSTIQWQYVGDTEWIDLIDLATLNGETGVGIDTMVINDLGELVVTYTDSSEVNLGTIITTYVVSFHDYNGHVLKTQVLAYGADANPPTDPIRTGYTFTGWDGNYANIMSDTDVYATYEINTYTVTFDSTGGELVGDITDVAYGSLLTLSEPTKLGHVFLGWFYGDSMNSNQFTAETPVTESITLYARWQLASYTVRYLDYDETELSVQEVLYNHSAVEPDDPSRVGHTFDGWSTSALNITADTDIHALYTVNEYAIQYITAAPNYNGVDDILLQPGDSMKQVSLGRTNVSAVLTHQGRLFVWGYNAHGEVGDGTTTNRHSPVDITNQFSLNPGETIESVFVGIYHLGALTSDGRVFVWGNNDHGQLGDGSTTNILVPTDITSQFHLLPGEAIVELSFGIGHSIARSSFGRMFAWGENNYGQVGDGSGADQLVPVDITSQFDLNPMEYINHVSAGRDHSAAVTSSGRVFTWGYNGIGQLGDGSTTNQPIPCDITAEFSLELGEIIIDLSLGYNSSAVVTSNARLFTWGSNFAGQLGDGTETNRYSPQDITDQFSLLPGERIVTFEIGPYGHSAAITSSYRIFTWGHNARGQLGDGTYESSSVPVDISAQFNGTGDQYAIAVSLGGYHSAILTEDGTIFAWGADDYGVLGFDTPINYQPNPGQMGLYSFEESSHIDMVDFDTEVVPYEPTLPGYAFDGWYTDSEFTTSYVITTMPAEDITLYGRWIINDYTMTFDTDGGDTISPVTQEYGSLIDVEHPTKLGHTFDGWYSDMDLTQPFDPKRMPAMDITLYAKWIVNQYNIDYVTYQNYDPLTDIPLHIGETIEQVALGRLHTIALTSQGRIFTWGDNTDGQLGDGTTTEHLLPVEITDDFDLNDNETIINIVVGHYHSMALTSVGRVFAWGNNAHGELGIGSTVDQATPIDITSYFGLTTGESIVSVSLGHWHSAALTTNGRVFTWGYNNYGQLGDGTTTNRLLPTDITTHFNLSVDETIILVTVNTSVGHSAAISSDGRVFSWGWNIKGQLGNGTFTDQLAPYDITSFFNLAGEEVITQIWLGQTHSAAMTSSDRIFTWGNNSYGQLGDGTTSTRNTPTEITDVFNLQAEETILDLQIGDFHAGATTSSGRVITWGWNNHGQLGDGTTINSSMPIDILNQFDLMQNEDIIKIRLGHEHTAVITSHGRLLIWGANAFGQLGDGTQTDHHTPQLLAFAIPHSVEAIAYDYDESLTAPKTIREGYTFDGWYSDMALTQPYEFTSMPAEHITLYAKWTVNEYTFTSVIVDGVDTSPFAYLLPGETITYVALGTQHSLAITSENRLLLWGYNNHGQLGDGGWTTSLIPIDISDQFELHDGETFVSASLGYYHSGVLTSEGRVFTWGYNNSGQLGTGTTADHYSPVDITTNFGLAPGETIVSLAFGASNSSALSSLGNVYTWGYNAYGQLGDGTNTNKSLPQNITTQFNLASGDFITALAMSEYHATVLSSNGQLFTWGQNNNGQLGDGTTTNAATPINITTNIPLSTGESVTLIAVGRGHQIIVTSDSRIFAWGQNDSGQLGDGTTTQQLSPIEITSSFGLASGETIVSVSAYSHHSKVLTSNGRILAWGSNTTGQLGDGTLNDALTPVDITSLITLDESETIAAAGSGEYHSYALTSDGGLWMWGYNLHGQLGNGTTILEQQPIVIPFDIYYGGVTMTYDYDGSIAAIVVDRPYYTLDGWYDDSALTNSITLDTMPANDVTVYARWLPTEYIISYVLDGGTNGANPASYNVESETIVLDDPTRTGYVFGGWYDNASFDGQAITEIIHPSHGEITLYARWIPAD